MSVNFNGITPKDAGNLRPKSETVGQAQKAVTTPSTPNTTAAEAKAPGDQVSFSSQARDLKELENTVRKLPDVNQDKVARIKAALAAGSYQIDNHKLAGKLLSFEEEIH